MDQKNNLRQWDDLLEQTFGNEGKPDVAFSASLPETKKRPFYRNGRFLLVAAVVILLLGAAIWLLTGNFVPERPTPTMPILEDTTMQDALALCKNALAQWQAQGNYHVKVSYLHYGDTMGGGASKADFWRNGDDYLYTMVIPGLLNGATMGYLKQNGTLYTSSASNYGGASSYGWESNTSEELQESDLIPWPMAFDWENSEITGRSTVRSQLGFSSVSFAVLRDSGAFALAAPYHVNFSFDSSQRLESVTVILTTPGSGSQAKSTVITYRLGTETSSEIEKKVGTALRMPLTPPLGTVPPA